jgi:hypothetical protein
MSVAGTLYEETVKFGHAKLLSTQTANNVVYMTFQSPFTSEFNSYHFDIINLTHGSSAYPSLGAQLMNASGAITGYWYSYFYNCSHSNVYGNAGSVVSSLDTNAIQLTVSSYPVNSPVTGEVFIHCAPGKACQFSSHVSVNHPSYGQGQMITGTALDAGCNGVRFFFWNGTPIISGTIRMYGLRSGLV